MVWYKILDQSESAIKPSNKPVFGRSLRLMSASLFQYINTYAIETIETKTSIQSDKTLSKISVKVIQRFPDLKTNYRQFLSHIIYA